MKNILKESLEHLDESPVFETIYEKIFLDYFGEKPESINAGEISKIIEGIEPKKHAQLIHSSLVRMLDLLHPPLFHRLIGKKLKGVDWEWMKYQVRANRNKGITNCGVILNADGRYSIGVINSEIGDVLDVENEVLFYNDLAGIEIIIKVRWEDLISGKALLNDNDKN